MVQWDFYIFKPEPGTNKVRWITVGRNPESGSGTYEDTVHIVSGRAVGAGWLPQISWEDYQSQFSADLPPVITQRIEKALQNAGSVPKSRTTRSEPGRFQKLILKITVKVE